MKGQDPVTMAVELRPLLARNAEQTEHERRLPRENIDALEEANLFKLMTPQRWGGYGASFATSMSVHAELAKGCASTAWVAMIVGGGMWVASLLPTKARKRFSAVLRARVWPGCSHRQ